jgi:ribosomal-protein-alanine N-acetyltransferase
MNLGQVILREINPRDAEDYYSYMNRIEMEEFLTAQNRPGTVEQALEELQYWKSLFPLKRSVYWAIALAENNKMIGTVGFNHISFIHARAEISYDLDPDYWGNGYMTGAIESILDFADQMLELVRIQATVIVDNQKSIKVLERCGFQREGTMKKYEIVKNQHKDYYIYARVV